MKKEIAAIYCRLSVEDTEKRAAESESIRNQRALLLGYAKKQGWAIYDIYADEDYSGLREDRLNPTPSCGCGRKKIFNHSMQNAVPLYPKRRHSGKISACVVSSGVRFW